MQKDKIHWSRSSYLNAVRTCIIDYIFKEAMRIKNDRINALCFENHNITKGGLYVIFDGVQYPKTVVRTRNTATNRVHPSLREKFSKAVHEQDYEEFETKHILNNYVGSILQFAKNKEDLFQLLPYPIHGILGGIANFNIDEPQEESAILGFLHNNDSNRQCLNMLLTERLLLKED